jgi:hypothetical protein
MSANVTLAEVERVLLSNFPFLAAVEVREKGKTIPHDQQLLTLYKSRHAQQRAAAASSLSILPSARSSTHARLLPAVCAERGLSFMVHPQHSAAYSLFINGGLPLSSGYQPVWTRHTLFYASVFMMLVSVLSLLLGDSPERPARDGDETDWERMTEQQKARAHWNMVVYDKSKDIADWLGIPPPPGYMTPEQREIKYRELHLKLHPEHAKQMQQMQEKTAGDDEEGEGEEEEEDEEEEEEPVISLRGGK